MSSLEGRQLGEFEILEMLGQGGMGAVYKARQVSLGRLVAIKTLQSTLAGDTKYIARFRQEARAAALLNHPNLVQVHSAGETEGVHWFAMEYVEGESARARLKREGRLDPADAVTIALHVAAALDYGWRKASLIHRDVKPDNIFLSTDGEVKLGDLGLAKSLGDSPEHEPQLELTAPGASMGTPVYMSPEQVEGPADVDLRTDIYSLGCTLYHLVSGKQPFTGKSAAAVMMQHVQAPSPDLRSAWPECPPALAEAVLKMMQREAGQRPQSYDEVCADLRRAYDEFSSQVIPARIEPAPPAESAPEKEVAVRREKRGCAGAAWAFAILLLGAGAAALFFAPWKQGQGGGLSRVEAAAISAGTAAKDKPFINSLGMHFVPVTISGGSTDGQRVLFSIWETRVQDYEVFVKETRRPWARPAFPQGPTHPVVLVSWEESALFCDWLTVREHATGRLPAGLCYRLPTEHEWIFAAEFNPRDEAAVFAAEKSNAKPDEPEAASAEADGAGKTLPVDRGAANPANRFGLFDLGGNVYQWCDNRNERDPGEHVLRGGSWLSRNRGTGRARFLRKPGFRSTRDGFRCVIATPLALAAAASPANAVSAPSASPAPPPKAAGPALPGMATKETPLVNGLGMKFVPVPIIGGPTAGKRILFSVWDTRVQDFEAFARETKVFWPKPEFAQTSLHPAVNVHWGKARQFCTWLTAREQAAGRLPDAWSYRLPTDHEWSCAAEIGGTEDAALPPGEKRRKLEDVFPWGAGWPPPPGAGNYAGDEAPPPDSSSKLAGSRGDRPLGYHDAFANTSPVGSFPANRFGLYDLGGNVWQLCGNGLGAELKTRIVRGASWDTSARELMLSSARRHLVPDHLSSDVGFRCVLGITAFAPPISAPAPAKPN